MGEEGRANVRMRYGPPQVHTAHEFGHHETVTSAALTRCFSAESCCSLSSSAPGMSHEKKAGVHPKKDEGVSASERVELIGVVVATVPLLPLIAASARATRSAPRGIRRASPPKTTPGPPAPLGTICARRMLLLVGVMRVLGGARVC